MKTIITRIQKSSRWGAMVLATVVAIITCLVVANATETITTPSSAFIPFSLAFNQVSAPIALPSNRSVLVMGCCTSPHDQGVGQATLLHIPNTLLQWVGLESYPYSQIVASRAYPPTAGTHIVDIDFDHQVSIEVASAAGTIRIRNNNYLGTRSGNVTLVW